VGALVYVFFWPNVRGKMNLQIDFAILVIILLVIGNEVTSVKTKCANLSPSDRGVTCSNQ